MADSSLGHRTMSDAICIDNLTVSYQRHPAVHHVSGTFAQGSLTAIVGPNGAGKSSLLAAITGDVRPSSGSIHIAPELRAYIAYLPQQAELDRSFPISVLDVVMLGHWARLGAFQAVSKSLREQGLAALEAVGLAGFEQRLVGELSVGQFQRVLFARILVQDAKVILLDEPFSAIDARTTSALLDVVRRWHGESRTVIAVLHDMAQVRENFPEALLMARELIAWGPTGEVLQEHCLQCARQLAERWDDDAPICHRSATR